jgi:hypothetical protein
MGLILNTRDENWLLTELLLTLVWNEGRMILENLGLGMLHILHVLVGDRHTIRAKWHLKISKLRIGLLNILESVLLAPVADFPERKVEVFARGTHPISHSLCQRLLNLLLLL